MVIKDAKKYDSEGTVQKKDKTKKATRNRLAATIEDGDAQLGLPTKAKGGKKKRSVEGNISNPKKKKKKKKKKLDSKLKNGTFVDLPITIQRSSDLELIKEEEKPPKALKKKRKRGLPCERESSPEIPGQGQATECLEANFLVRKKCEREVPETWGGNSGHNTKRKKKKHKLACSLISSHAEDAYSEKDLAPTMKTISHEMILPDSKRTLIQDAVSKGKSKRICCLTSTDSREARNGVLEEGAADPTHELQEKNNCKQDHKDTAHVSKKRRQAAEREGKKKWKKKKKLKEEEVDLLLTLAGQPENHPAISTETLGKSKAEEKTKKTDLTQNSKGDIKGHKKKRIYTKFENNYPDLLEDNKGAFDWEGKAAAIKRAKKKGKKSKKERDPAARLGSSGFWENSGKQWDAAERKAKKREGSQTAEEEPSSKQAKLKDAAKAREDEIQVVAVKKGNCDEVKIDKLRRQALQEEIDRESGKTKAVKEQAELDHHFGQWSTATFDSTERRTKFLRLLGGFKKGPALTQDSPAKGTKLNMALARHGEEKLEQTLQSEFEKAMDWKQRRGTGLGFQPAPRKQVYIDKYASKSVKFED